MSKYNRPSFNSSNYIGNSSNVIRSSSSTYKSSNNVINSSNIITKSSQNFSSSNDILLYLKTHPHFVRGQLADKTFDAILAAITSGLSITGGVVLAIVSGGTTSPGIILCSSLLISTGVSGGQNAISGLINNNFSWTDWAIKTATSGGVTLLTFGGGFLAGNITGMALMGKGLSETCIKTMGACAGAFAGAGIRTGTYVIINQIEGKDVEMLQLILEGVSGAISGGFAGYLGAKCAILTQPIIPLDELNRLNQIGNLDKKDALNLDKIIDKIKNNELTLDDVKQMLSLGGHSDTHVLENATSNAANLGSKAMHGLFLSAEEQAQLVFKALTSPQGLQVLNLLKGITNVNKCISFSALGYLKEMMKGKLSFLKELGEIRVVVKALKDGTIRIITSFPVASTSLPDSYISIFINTPRLISECGKNE
jgi:hypothetical protein